MATKKILSEREKQTTREVVMLGVVKRVRKITPSKEAIKTLGLRTKKEIVGHMAVNPPEIEKTYRLEKAKILREMTMMSPAERNAFIDQGPIDFIKDKDGREKYDILCANCGDRVAYVWARDDKMTDWCDLHYICWYNKESWRGAMAINVSPIDGKLGFECACGEDTRDYRANRTLPPIQKSLMIEYSQKHRDFATPNSKFIGVQI